MKKYYKFAFRDPFNDKNFYQYFSSKEQGYIYALDNCYYILFFEEVVL